MAISLTITFTYKLGHSPSQTTRLTYPHRYRVSLALNHFAGDLATKQHFFTSQQYQETMLKQMVEPVSSDTKEEDDSQ